MILSGDKKEEYREIKGYWEKRLFEGGEPRRFDRIEFVNGYSPDSPRFEVEYLGVSVRQGREEWGAEKGKEYFVLKLGKVI